MTSPRFVALPIRRVTQLDLTCDDGWRWPFAEQRREDIDIHFAKLRETKPELWNGRVLLARQPQFSDDTFSARYFETDFASFLAWRDWGFPDTDIVNGFGMGALRGSDGGFLLGEMAAHTANAGRVYFASGTPDLSDLHDGLVDIAASVAREVAEEVGLEGDDYVAAPTWECVATGPLVAMIRRLDVALPTAVLRKRVEGFIAGQSKPELCAVHVVHGRGDISSAMPGFIAAYLSAQFDGPAADASRRTAFPGV